MRGEFRVAQPVQAAVFIVRSNSIGIAETEKAIREFKNLRSHVDEVREAN